MTRTARKTNHEWITDAEALGPDDTPTWDHLDALITERHQLLSVAAKLRQERRDAMSVLRVEMIRAATLHGRLRAMVRRVGQFRAENRQLRAALNRSPNPDPRPPIGSPEARVLCYGCAGPLTPREVANRVTWCLICVTRRNDIPLSEMIREGENR